MRDRDPTRWRADPTRRPAGAAHLLRGVRRPRPPQTDELARLGDRVDEIPRRSAIRARRMRIASSVAAGLSLAVLATGVWALRGQRRLPPAPSAAPALWAEAASSLSRPTTLARAPLAAPEAPARATRVSAPAPSRARRLVARTESVRPVRHERPAPPAPSAVDADALTREIALIDAARGDLDATPARALAALDKHRREFPRGQLAAEREFLAVESLSRLNRTDEARRRVAELQERYPSSSYAARAARLLRPAP